MTREDAERGEWVPATLFTTSTADDRVHPSHARRFVHKMRRLGIGGEGAVPRDDRGRARGGGG